MFLVLVGGACMLVTFCNSYKVNLFEDNSLLSVLEKGLWKFGLCHVIFFFS